MYSEYPVVSVQKAEAVCRIFVDLAFDLTLDISMQLQLQNKLAEVPLFIFLP